MRRAARPLLAACAGLAASSLPARADRFEASIAVRPAGGYARISEAGTDERPTVRSAGLAAGLSWGVRNWLDLGGELSVTSLGEAFYDRAMLTVDAAPMAGPLKRMSRASQLRGVATVRFGVAWVPTLQLAIGPGARQRSSALLRGTSVQGETIYVPDGLDAGISLDIVTAVRVGLERRLTERWTIGVSAGAAHVFGVGSPDIQMADASVTVARVWYPNW